MGRVASRYLKPIIQIQALTNTDGHVALIKSCRYNAWAAQLHSIYLLWTPLFAPSNSINIVWQIDFRSIWSYMDEASPQRDN